MKKLFFVVLTSVLLAGCSEGNSVEVKNENQKESFNPNAPFEFNEQMFLKVALSKIGAVESEVSWEVGRAHLNEDGIQDAYLSVNLSKRAQKDVENAKNPSFLVDLGYLGNYNYLVIWDGETKQVSNPYLISSNGLEALKVKEQNLLDPGYKTLSAVYRVKNSAFEVFFRYLNGSIVPVFSYKIIDGIGTDYPEAFVHEIVDNPQQLQQDIIIYEAEIPGYKAISEHDPNYYPMNNLIAKPTVVARFFFEKSMGKYATNVE